MTGVPPLVSANAVVRRFGPIKALDGVSLEIAPGEFFGLLGPNGAGKSTFMSLVSGIRSLDSGTLTVDGAGVAAGSASARLALGLVPQNIALYFELSAERNLRIFGELYGLRGARLGARIDFVLDAVGIADRRKGLVKTFSGGMQRRLNLAAALLHEPRARGERRCRHGRLRPPLQAPGRIQHELLLQAHRGARPRPPALHQPAPHPGGALSPAHGAHPARIR